MKLRFEKDYPNLARASTAICIALHFAFLAMLLFLEINPLRVFIPTF